MGRKFKYHGHFLAFDGQRPVNRLWGLERSVTGHREVLAMGFFLSAKAKRRSCGISTQRRSSQPKEDVHA